MNHPRLYVTSDKDLRHDCLLHWTVCWSPPVQNSFCSVISVAPCMHFLVICWIPPSHDLEQSPIFVHFVHLAIKHISNRTVLLELFSVPILTTVNMTHFITGGSLTMIWIDYLVFCIQTIPRSFLLTIFTTALTTSWPITPVWQSGCKNRLIFRLINT